MYVYVYVCVCVCVCVCTFPYDTCLCALMRKFEKYVMCSLPVECVLLPKPACAPARVHACQRMRKCVACISISVTAGLRVPE